MRFQVGERLAQSRKIGRVSHDGEIGVAAKLGRAVEYARLPAHEQRADAVLLHRRIAAERGVALGWPAFSLRGDYFGSWSYAANHPFLSEERMAHLFQLMALPVWWPGFLINWFLYALLLIAAVRGSGMIR
ncbi:MAG: hypothetical protein ACOYMU_10505 [Phycisphaerales bacterium]